MLRQVNRHFGGIEKELKQKLKVRGIRKWKNGFVGILLHKILSWHHLQSFDRAKRNFFFGFLFLAVKQATKSRGEFCFFGSPAVSRYIPGPVALCPLVTQGLPFSKNQFLKFL